jgi:hypothetical protein
MHMGNTEGTLTVRIKGVPFPIQFSDWTHDRLYHTVEFEGGDSQEIDVFIGGLGAQIPGGSRVLTEVDTNIPRSGDTGLQDGWEALVYSIQLQVVREMGRNGNQQAFALQDVVNTAPAAIQFSRNAHLGGYDPANTAGGVLFDFSRKMFHRFSVNQKRQSEGPFEKYPQGSGQSVFGTTTSLEVANNGAPSPRDQSAFVLPIHIKPNIAYVGQLRPQAPLGLGGAIANVGPPFPTVNGYYDWTGILASNLGMDIRETLEGLIKRPVV